MASERYLDEHALVGGFYTYKADEEREAGHTTWPSKKYSADPIGFCVEILGFAPTTDQASILISIRDNDRTAVRSGRKVGKSRIAAAAALWFYTQHDNATIVLCAPSERQITEVVWYDLLKLFHESGRCLSCKLRDPDGPRPCPHSSPIDGELSATVRTGLRSGQRRIFGLAPRNADNARGVSGPNQLWLLDESPGIARPIYDAADGNRAAGAKLAAFGNPSSRSGWFFDAHTTLAFNRIAISSLNSPNNVFGRKLVPGLADTKWLEEKRTDWGEEDARWFVEVLGEFPTRDLVRLITEEEIGRAIDRHDELDITTDGLTFGIDPAGGGGGDSSVIVMRRAAKVLEIRSFMGGTDTIMSELDVMLARERRRPTEKVRINFDAASSYGRDLAVALRQRRNTDEYLTFDALESRGDARNDVLLKNSGCARPKDAFWLNMVQRLKSEVGIPFDDELREELIFAEWQPDREGGSRLIEKKTFRQRLGRSPDKADALAYCLWEGRVAPLSRAAAATKKTPESSPSKKRDSHRAHNAAHGRAGAFDPYAALDPFGGRKRR